MSTGKKILYSVLAAQLGGVVFFILVYGFKGHKAADVASGVFSPVDEFKLDTWFKAGPVAFNKGVLYLLITVVLTLGVMLYIARRLKQRPGRLQVAIEAFYDFTRKMSRENLDDNLERKYFPLIATIFVFILVTNLIGYI
ncbi:MAG TPA: F0F1 ATP synthase subunit A, partial [Solirubrobacteraceae bacterium]|nr:F0F1 ATP synthase subunit A [Solirubrobacteraceae bacterium]